MKTKSFIGVCVSLAVLSLVFVVQGQTGRQGGAAPAARQPVPAATAKPAAAASHEAPQAVIQDYCVECHNKTARIAGLAIDELNIARVGDNVKDWEKIVRKLRAGMMPPAGQERPDKDTYMGLITWLENELDRTATPFAPPPGVHRLNRTEYANAIKDLLDLTIDPAQYLPSDDSTRGFDNIASALTVSSTLVDSWVSAGGKLSRLAIGDPATPTLKVIRVPEDTSQHYHIEGLPFGTRGGLLTEHIFPSDGEYTLSVTTVIGDNMSQNAFGTVPCEKLLILLDGERIDLLDWSASGGRGGGGGNCTPASTMGGSGNRGAGQAAAGQGGGGGGGGMRVRFKTTAGPHMVGVTFLATNFAPLLDMNRQFMRTTVQTGPTPGFTFFPHVGSIRIEGPFNATMAKDSPSRRKIFTCTPTAPANESACARRIITNLATQAYRRPATAADLEVLMNRYQESRATTDFEHAVADALAHILASPQFLARIEVEPATVKPGQLYRISDLELASRLSFFLWSTGPDKQLMDLATQRRLQDPVVLEQQVRRMLKDPRAEALSRNFAGQWLNLRGMDAVGPLPLIYPDFDDPLRQAMRREVELLFDAIRTEDRSMIDLLTADFTFVNERLAKHYGIEGIYGSQFRRVTLGADMDVRRGLLGKGAVLVTTAKPERNSPVTRGKWIISTILGVPPPDPPPDVPPLPAKSADARGNAKTPSMRKMMLDHRVRDDCIRCHSLMDPIGFTLENFDGIGVWRTEDEGEKIAASEMMYDGTPVQGPVGLRNWVLGYSDTYMRVAAEKLLTYGLGRGAEAEDMPLVRRIVRDASRNNNRFSSLVVGVVLSQPFRNNMKVQETSIQNTGSRKEGN